MSEKQKGCICAFQETNRNCPVHGAERSAQLASGKRDWQDPTKPNHWQDPRPDPQAFRCPHCGVWRPAFMTVGQGQNWEGGGIEYMNLCCAECYCILQTLVTFFAPGIFASGGSGRKN